MGHNMGLRRLLHWGPILALTVITVISLSSFNCILQWWPPFTIGGIINIAIYMFWNVTTLYNFFHAAFVGPGYVALGWKPVCIMFMSCLLHLLCIKVNCRGRNLKPALLTFSELIMIETAVNIVDCCQCCDIKFSI